jgi:hypothetical protein
MEIKSIDCPKCGGNIPEQVMRGKLFKCNHCGSTLVWPDKRSILALSFGVKLCPDCGLDNEQTRGYCRNCGTSLTKACYLCKTSFYVGDNYCPNGHDYEYERQKYEYEEQKWEKVKRVDILSHLHESEILAMKGDLEQAAQILEDALGINPKWVSKIAGFPCQTILLQTEPVSGYALLVHLAGKAGNKKLALKYFERMLDLALGNPLYARQAAREAGIERDAKVIARKRGIPWHWWQ